MTRRGLITAAAMLPLADAAFAGQAQAAGLSAPDTVHGTVQPGYEAARTAFEENLASGKELGASVAVYRDGAPLVDLWGGIANEATSVPAAQDTLYTLMSTTKGLTALCIAMLVDRGKLAAAAGSSLRGISFWGSDQNVQRAYGFPAAGGTASARALAKLYGHLVGSEGPGVKPLLSKAAFHEATRERIAGIDQTSGGLARYAAGFRLNEGKMGSSPAAFGHAGFGGSVAFADPTRRLGIAYTPNRMLNPNWQ